MCCWLHLFEGNHETTAVCVDLSRGFKMFYVCEKFKLHWAVLSCIELYWAAFVCIELYWIALSCIELYWVLEIHRRTRTVQNMSVFNDFSNCIELYWAAFVRIELYWIALSCIELYWVFEIHRRARPVQNMSVFNNWFIAILGSTEFWRFIV